MKRKSYKDLMEENKLLREDLEDACLENMELIEHKKNNNYMEYIDDVFDAIESYFEEEPQTIANILIELLKYLNNNSLKLDSKKWFEKNGYCKICGSKLQLYSCKEPHTELDNNDDEVYWINICPNCDKMEVL